MTCPRCGSPVTPGIEVCGACGQPIEITAAAAPPIPPAPQGADPLFEALRKALAREYEVQGLIGTGPLALVYRAVERQSGRTVAIKALPIGSPPALGERFRKEARVAANLTHTNIVPIYKSGQAGGTDYFVMKFVQGRSIGALVEQQGALAVPVVVLVLRGLVAGLAYSHDRRVIHRDVSSANVFVDSEGAVALADPGIARALEDKAAAAAGHVAGTPAYLSPELCGGQRATPQSDQYAVGVLGYLMLTGVLPYEADTPQRVVELHAAGPPPDMSETRGDVPAELEAVVRKAMAGSGAQRYASTREMLRALEAVPLGEAELKQAREQLRQLGQGESVAGVLTRAAPRAAAPARPAAPKAQPRPPAAAPPRAAPPKAPAPPPKAPPPPPPQPPPMRAAPPEVEPPPLEIVHATPIPGEPPGAAPPHEAPHEAPLEFVHGTPIPEPSPPPAEPEPLGSAAELEAVLARPAPAPQAPRPAPPPPPPPPLPPPLPPQALPQPPGAARQPPPYQAPAAPLAPREMGAVAPEPAPSSGARTSSPAESVWARGAAPRRARGTRARRPFLWIAGGAVGLVALGAGAAMLLMRGGGSAPPVVAPADTAASADTAVAPAVLPTVGYIRVGGDVPEGAILWLDGRRVRGRVIEAARGLHTLEVEAADFEPWEIDVEVEVGDTVLVEVEMVLRQLPSDTIP